MANSRRKKKIRFSKLMLGIGLVAVSLSLGVTLVSTQVELVAKRQQLDSITAQVDAQKADNTEMQRTLDNGNEDGTIERFARDKLGYALPGERIYVDMSGK